MTFAQITKKLIISTSFLCAAAHAAVLNPGPYVYGKVGSERGEIIRNMPGAKPAYRLQCNQGQCEKRVIGYIYRRNDHLEAVVSSYLPDAHNAKSEALIQAARSASLGLAADGASTAAGLAAGATELNPLLGASPDPVSLIAVGLLRQRLLSSALNDPRLSAEQKAKTLCTNAGLATGAAANNIAVLAAGGGVLPIIVGLIVGHAQHESCMAKVHEAQAWIEARENQGLRAYAASLAPQKPDGIDLAASDQSAIQL